MIGKAGINMSKKKQSRKKKGQKKQVVVKPQVQQNKAQGIIHNKIFIISISFAILLLLIALVYFLFFNYSIKGSWTMPNEGNSVYTFDDNNKISLRVGSTTVNGQYEMKDNNKVEIKLEDYLNGEYKYSLSGNVFSGYELSLSQGKYEFDFIKSDEDNTNIDDFATYKVSKELIGKWVNGNSTYQFNEDGSCVVKDNKILINGKYNVFKNKIIVKYKGTTNNVININYSVVDDKTITLSNQKYRKK